MEEMQTPTMVARDEPLVMHTCRDGGDHRNLKLDLNIKTTTMTE